MSGEEMRIALTNLSVHFDDLAVPRKGRYVDDPAVADAAGFKYIPPKPKDNTLLILAAGAVVAGVALAYLLLSGKQRKKKTILQRLGEEYLPKKLKGA
jgi:hypothetical protein